MAADAHDPELPDKTRVGRRMQAAVYGTILVLSVIAVASEYQGKPLRIAGSVIATQIILYLAHVYAGQLGVRLELGRTPSRAELREVFVEEWPLLAAAGPPCLALLIGGLSPLNDRVWIAIALTVGVSTLVLYAVRLAVAEGRSAKGIALTAGINGSLGLVLVALKSLVH